jgi:hypothetical protein
MRRKRRLTHALAIGVLAVAEDAMLQEERAAARASRRIS